MQGFRFERKENGFWTIGSLALPIQRLDPLYTFLRIGWHDWRYKADFNASDEQRRSRAHEPVYEPIRDYWIDSRLGPGYSPH
jgi:hypothetical protein